MDHQVYFNDGQFVPLHHPGEAYALQKLGVKEDDALLQGHIYWQNYLVCLDCRSIATTRSVRLPDYFGTWRGRTDKAIIWSVIIVGAVALLFLEWPMYAVLPALLPVLIGFDLLVTAIARHKARRCAEQLEMDLRAKRMVHENDDCHHCGGTRLADYLRFEIEHRNDNGKRGEPMRCPKCDQIQLYHDYTYTAIA